MKGTKSKTTATTSKTGSSTAASKVGGGPSASGQRATASSNVKGGSKETFLKKL